MSNLIIKAGAPGKDGLVAAVSKESARWEYVGFEVYQLQVGDTLSRSAEGNEICLVLLAGKADVRAGAQLFAGIGERMSVFEDLPPYAVYIPAGGHYEVTALTELELAVCLAPGTGKYAPRLIAPCDTVVKHAVLAVCHGEWSTFCLSRVKPRACWSWKYVRVAAIGPAILRTSMTVTIYLLSLTWKRHTTTGLTRLMVL